MHNKDSLVHKKGFAPLAIFGVILLVGAGFVFAQYMIKNPIVSGQELKQFQSCDQIKSFLQENSGSSYSGILGISSRTFGNAVPMAAGAEKSEDTSAGSSAPDYSTTNVQVEGVDEPDIVKNDGKYIYTLSGSQIFIVDAYPAEGSQLLSTINSTGASNIFINGDRLVVFGTDYLYPDQPVIEKIGISMPRYYPTYSQQTYIHVYDISDRKDPKTLNEFAIDGYYADARMVGDYVYLIANKGVSYGEGPVPLPMVYSESGSRPACGCTDLYYFDVPDYSYQFVTIASLNVKDDSAEPQTKVVMSGYTGTIFVSQQNIYLSYMKQVSYWDQSERLINALKPLLPSGISESITSIQSSDSPRDEKVQQIGELIQDYYNSLSESEKASFMEGVQDATQAVYTEIQKETQKTVIQKIGIDNGNIDYVGKGEVSGRLLNQFSMDEYEGFLRVATTVDATWNWRSSEQSSPSQNNVYVLDSGMRLVGSLEDLAPGESIYSARFMGDRAFLVTFKRVDPLFVIGLSDPSNPTLLGKLKIPGYSDYLHPYDENHLIGIGKEVNESIDADKVHTDDAVYYTAIQGVKLSLFDVSDLSNPQEIAKYVIGDRGTESAATSDHKAFLFDKEKNLLVIPIQLAEFQDNQEPEFGGYGEYTFQGAYVFSLTPADGFTLRGRITHADQATEKNGYWYSPYTIQRSLYIGENLYTISSGMVKANSLSDLSELKAIKLPVAEPEIYPLYKGGTGIIEDVAMGGGVSGSSGSTPPSGE
jgi:inhibitor of cysteine peptidase